MTATDILTHLEDNHFRDGPFVRVRELRPSVGYGAHDRRIDLWAMKCAPSAGMPAHAIEVKVSRSDWLRELKKPRKRRAAMAISNYFWIAAPVGIVKDGELPEGCGLIEFEPERMNDSHYRGLVTEYPVYQDKVRCTWGLLASVLRNLGKKAKP